MSSHFVFKIISTTASATIDVVFIHGLSGDCTETWTSKSSGEPDGDYWPLWLAADIQTANVFALGYPAKVLTDWAKPESSLHERAKACLEELAAAGLGQRPICLVAYSLGGLLAKQIVRTGSQAID